MKKYKVEKSLFPEGEATYLVVAYSISEYGRNIQRVFKGRYKDCIKRKKELEEYETRTKTSSKRWIRSCLISM